MVVTTKGTLKCKTLAKGVAMDKNQLRFHGVIFKETIVMNMVPNSPPSPSCRSNRAPATMFHKSSFTDIKTAFNRGFKVTCWSWLQLFVLFYATDTGSSPVREMICKCIGLLFMHFVYAGSRFQIWFIVLSNTFHFLRAAGFNPFFG
jgi:hypothetical protein